MDRFLTVFLGFLIAIVMLLTGVVVVTTVSHPEGVVTDKYYDDPDLVCSKGCTITSECWTIVVGSEPWWNDTACVSEERYRSIHIGDNFKE